MHKNTSKYSYIFYPLPSKKKANQQTNDNNYNNKKRNTHTHTSPPQQKTNKVALFLAQCTSRGRRRH